ncbi:hypothetical protein F4810DRAFT_712293 [Camillea tinctor]|nr:hypothetical protein F4810DRAFT_712293 [Camillea tinctor]
MAAKEFQPLVNNCCTFCCKAVDFGTHDYCGTNWDSSVTVYNGATFVGAIIRQNQLAI